MPDLMPHLGDWPELADIEHRGLVVGVGTGAVVIGGSDDVEAAVFLVIRTNHDEDVLVALDADDVSKIGGAAMSLLPPPERPDA